MDDVGFCRAEGERSAPGVTLLETSSGYLGGKYERDEREEHLKVCRFGKYELKEKK